MQKKNIFMNLCQFLKLISWNMGEAQTIFIEFDFLSNEARLMKKVYRIHFYDSYMTREKPLIKRLYN